MFKIDYNIISASFDNIDTITDSDLRYNFLLGNVFLRSDESTIMMDWGWIPLFDFSIGLSEISRRLKEDENSKELFDFTESSETIEFLREGESLLIYPSFSFIKLRVNFDEFDYEVNVFKNNIIVYIKENIKGHVINDALSRYL